MLSAALMPGCLIGQLWLQVLESNKFIIIRIKTHLILLESGKFIIIMRNILNFFLYDYPFYKVN